MLICLLFTQASALALDTAEGQADSAMHQYMVRRVETVARLGMYGSWPVEEKAALDAFRLELGLMEWNSPVRSLPDEPHLTQEDALRLVKDVIAQEYQVYEDQLEGFLVEYEFLAMQNGMSSWWRLLLQSEEHVSPYSAYLVELDSPSGDVLLHAGQESWLIGMWQIRFDSTEEDDISPEEAERIAREHVLEMGIGINGLDEHVLSCYHAHIQLWDDTDMGRVYFVELNPLDGEVFNYFGAYNVFIDPKTGIVWDGYKGNG